MGLALSATKGIAFIVSYGAVCEIIAKVNSSPQTTELNAEKRAPTLMKWVHLGMAESVLVVGVAVCFEKKEMRFPFLLGGAMGMVITEAEYLYAKKSGLEKVGAPTEDWDDSRREEGGFVVG
jgi:hypothetical protein